MSEKISPIEAILDALPAVQVAVKDEIASRIAAGEKIGSMSDAEMRARSRAVLSGIRTERVPKKSAA